VLLDAVARSDGTRPSVARELLATRVQSGIVGGFAITPDGDTTARTISLYRVEDGALNLWRVTTPP
jgi:hypothetical protein